MGLTKDIATTITKLKESKRQRKDAEKRYRELLATVQAQDWEPTYTADLFKNNQFGGTASFGRTQSPMARAYLESFLSGSNPNAMSSLMDPTGEQRTKAEAQFNNRYGGWDELAEKERELDSKPLYSVETPTEAILSPEEAMRNLGGEFSNGDFRRKLGQDTPGRAAYDKVYGEYMEATYGDQERERAEREKRMRERAGKRKV